MSAKAPWWFSGDAQEGRPFDLSGLATGAQFVVDWARESLLTTHQTHIDPADHPQCLMCRAMELFGSTPDQAPEPPDEGEALTWIDLDPPR